MLRTVRAWGGIKGKKVVTWRGAVKATTGLLPCPATSLTIPDIITQLLNGSHAPVQDHPARDSNPRFLMYMTNLIGFEPRNHLIMKVKIGTKKEINKLATCLKSPDKASNYFWVNAYERRVFTTAAPVIMISQMGLRMFTQPLLFQGFQNLSLLFPPDPLEKRVVVWFLLGLFT